MCIRDSLNESGPYLSANVELMPEPEAVAPESEQEALIRFAREPVSYTHLPIQTRLP